MRTKRNPKSAADFSIGLKLKSLLFKTDIDERSSVAIFLIMTNSRNLLPHLVYGIFAKSVTTSFTPPLYNRFDDDSP